MSDLFQKMIDLIDLKKNLLFCPRKRVVSGVFALNVCIF